MRSRHSRKPALAVARSGLPNSDPLGGAIDSGCNTSGLAAQSCDHFVADPAANRYWHEAVARWPGADRLRGLARRFVVVSHCWTPPTISFHRTRKQAETVLADLAQDGCTRCLRRPRVQCVQQHEIVDLRKRPKSSEGAP
jgi:hypothetical protein